MRISILSLAGLASLLSACLDTTTTRVSIGTSSSGGTGVSSTGANNSTGAGSSAGSSSSIGTISTTGSTSGGTSAGSTSGPAYEIRVSTVAGGGTLGFADGPGGRGGGALFGYVAGLAFDPAGNLYVADESNAAVRKIDPSGNVTTLAGNGAFGDIDGSGGRNGPAEFYDPHGLAVDSAGDVLVADWGNHNIRRVAPDGMVSTLPVSEVEGVPFGVLSDIMSNTDGSLDVTDLQNSRVCMIDAEHDAGITIDPVITYPYTEGLAQPEGLAMDGAGNVYVSNDTRVVILSTDGGVGILAGNGTPGFADGSGGADGGAEFQSLGQMAFDDEGNLIVADSFNNRIRKIDRAGNVTTIAGTGEMGDADGYGGPDGGARFAWPFGVAIDDAGSIYIADKENFAIRKITFYRP